MADRGEEKMEIQKSEYLAKEKSFLDEIKSVFHNFLRAIVWWKARKITDTSFNPFVPNAPFLYPLKTSENLKVFLMFSGGRERVHWEKMS